MTDSDRIVEVEWEDSVTTYGWQNAASLPRCPSVIYSWGAVEQDDERGMLLLEARSQRPPATELPEKGYGHATFIPRSAIRKVIELAPRRK